MTVKINGKAYNYNYLEPMSQWIGSLASAISEIKRARRTGATGESAKRLLNRIGGMYSDQTYLRSVGDMVKIVSDGDAYTARQMAVSYLSSWLPNVYDTALRNTDPYIRERRIMGEKGERASMGKQIMREAIPTQNLLPPPKVDFFGNDIEIPGQKSRPETMFMVRMLSPVTRRYTVEGKQGQVIDMLTRWNSQFPSDDPRVRWFQEPSRSVTVGDENLPNTVREEMNEKEYYLYAKLSGLLATELIESETWNYSNPTQEDILKIEKVFTKSRDAARKYVQAARQAKRLGLDKDYRQYISEMDAEIKTRSKP
jgi:hypothetical protein